MNPSPQEGRRQARAEALSTTFGGHHAVIYTDASRLRGQQYAIIVGATSTSLLAFASLKMQVMTAAEEAAIALALAEPWVRKVVAGSGLAELLVVVDVQSCPEYAK